MRSKQDGRRALPRHLGSSAYSWPRSAPFPALPEVSGLDRILPAYDRSCRRPLADVSGHGVPAALIASTLKVAFAPRVSTGGGEKVLQTLIQIADEARLSREFLNPVV